MLIRLNGFDERVCIGSWLSIKVKTNVPYNWISRD